MEVIAEAGIADMMITVSAGFDISPTKNAIPIMFAGMIINMMTLP